MTSRLVLTDAMAFKPYSDIKTIWSEFNSDTIKFDASVTLRGACVTVRKANAGALLFIELIDGSTVKTLQCVCDSSPADEADKRHQIDWKPLFAHCSRGATVELVGRIMQSPAKGQPIELLVDAFKCLGPIADPEAYPLGQRGYLPRDFLRTIPHQRHHAQVFLAIQLIKQCAYNAFHERMYQLGIGEVQPTIITSNECEEGAHPFTVTTLVKPKLEEIPSKDGMTDFSKDFFGKQVYLTVSSQLHLEATVLGTRLDGYCMTPAFRAEPSTGPLHLAEFLMPEWELIGGGVERNMAVAQSTLQYVFKRVLENCMDEVVFLEEYRKKDEEKLKEVEMGKWKAKKALIQKKELTKKEWSAMKVKIEEEFKKRAERPSIIERLERYANEPFIVATHDQCVKTLLEHIEQGKVVFDETPGYGEDFSKQHEFYITQEIYGGYPVFVQHYPKKIKAFYMPVIESTDEVERVDCYDLLFPFVGEVVGGSQRIHDYSELVQRMDEMHMDKEGLKWYLDLRKDASLPHGGAGLGFGRMLIVISGINNIKDFQEFPRAFAMQCFA